MPRIIRTTPILIDRHVGNLSVVEGNQNVGKDLIPGDLRLTEVSFTPPSRSTYLSVLAGLRWPLPKIIGNTAISIDSNVIYCVVIEPSELQKELNKIN